MTWRRPMHCCDVVDLYSFTPTGNCLGTGGCDNADNTTENAAQPRSSV
jgi:hypothetical protein